VELHDSQESYASVRQNKTRCGRVLQKLIVGFGECRMASLGQVQEVFGIQIWYSFCLAWHIVRLLEIEFKVPLKSKEYVSLAVIYKLVCSKNKILNLQSLIWINDLDGIITLHFSFSSDFLSNQRISSIWSIPLPTP